MNFNSKKVRLIHPNVLEYNRLIKFQFQKGSINTCCTIVHTDLCQIFQFQKGSINTLGQELIDPYIPIFQFQKGSINTLGVEHAHEVLIISIPKRFD